MPQDDIGVVPCAHLGVAGVHALHRLAREFPDEQYGQVGAPKHLRDASCRAGRLLLTCLGKKKCWIHPETRKRICFLEKAEQLNREAWSITESDPWEIRVSVYGLDPTDPTKERSG
ncbi:MAG: hypothetical protein OXH79_02095 [Boseongicola sp.]|nr:hypothetical protein [Boseongicola sp.]